jgi:hypothetical protein
MATITGNKPHNTDYSAGDATIKEVLWASVR